MASSVYNSQERVAAVVEGPDRIVGIVERERARLRNFIHRRVPKVARNRITDLFRRRQSERRRLVAEIERALNELPDEQRAVFVAHELQGQRFKSMAAETGVNVNTLLARKRYAVLYLRKRLQRVFDEMRDRPGG